MNSESKEQQDSDNQVTLSIPLRYDAEIHFTRYAELCKQTFLCKIASVILPSYLK